MLASELAEAFNTSTERKQWRATLGGSRVAPHVHFISVGSMVRLTYYLADDTFKVEFSRTQVAFGDFMASIYRSLSQVLAAFKAAGYPFQTPVDIGVLRVEYDPRTKTSSVAIARPGDDWQDAEPLAFKVPERVIENTSENPLDAL
jgi:hypothetical protein